MKLNRVVAGHGAGPQRSVALTYCGSLLLALVACGSPNGYKSVLPPAGSHAPAAHGSATPSATASAPPAAALDGTAPAFLTIWPKIRAALVEGRGDTLVNADLGLITLFHAGAYPLIQDFPTYSAAFDQLVIRPGFDCELHEGPLPEIDCSAGAFLEVGCVLTQPAPLQLASAYVGFMTYVLGEAPEADYEQALKAREALVSTTLTDTRSSYRLHFGVVAGRWTLLVVDAFPKGDAVTEFCPS